MRAQALPPARILGVETGGCPHTAIREDASINLEAIERLQAEFPALDVVFVESGGDNLAATFSPELSDLTLYVIDVAGGREDPAQGRAGHHPLAIFSSSTRPISRRTSAPRSRSWRAMRASSGASGRSSSPA